MFKNFAGRAAALSGLLALAGCVTPDPQLTYTAPFSLTPQTGATILGSLNKTNALTSDEKVFLVSVDNKTISAGLNGWSVPQLLPPGMHVLNVEACECGFMSGNYSGSVSLAVDLQPGQSYLLHATLPYSAGLFHPGEMQAWITDSAGHPVGSSSVAAMSTPPQPVFIPIIIPAR